MYVTLSRKIPVPPEALAACLIAANLSSQQILLFLSQEIIIIDYSTLHQKQTLLIYTYLYEINTDPITYPIDAHWRWTLIPVLSHTPCG